LLVTVTAALPTLATAMEPATPDPNKAAHVYAMAIAFEGDLERADSLFERLVLQRPGDPRALTNLGNVKLLEDKVETALAFYDRAARTDSTDAGIVLNQSTAYLLLGDREQANDRAAVAIALAGGFKQAAGLIGLRRAAEQAADASKAGDRPQISSEELLANLFEAARGRVPTDTIRGLSRADSAAAMTQPKRKRKGPRWRIAATRGEVPDAARNLYWKQ